VNKAQWLLLAALALDAGERVEEAPEPVDDAA
jgi:hypothetical protein